MVWPKAGHRTIICPGASRVFKGCWPVPNTVTELLFLATVGRCGHPRNSLGVPAAAGQRDCMGPTPWLLKSFLSSRTFGWVPIWSTALSVYRNVPSGFPDSPFSTASFSSEPLLAHSCHPKCLPFLSTDPPCPPPRARFQVLPLQEAQMQERRETSGGPQNWSRNKSSKCPPYP